MLNPVFFFFLFSHAVLCTQALMLLGYFPLIIGKKIILIICLFVFVITRVKIRNKHSRWINMVNTELICTDRNIEGDMGGGLNTATPQKK